LSRTLRALDNRCGFPSAGCSALCASQPANAEVNPVSKLKFAVGLAADPQRFDQENKYGINTSSNNSISSFAPLISINIKTVRVENNIFTAKSFTYIL
jgi:hypothetical protein